jgi:hypothetical protein
MLVTTPTASIEVATPIATLRPTAELAAGTCTTVCPGGAWTALPGRSTAEVPPQ